MSEAQKGTKGTRVFVPFVLFCGYSLLFFVAHGFS
jgi:hypothetical protein